MTYTKYLFTPHDLAVFIIVDDLSHTEKAEVITDLFENHNAEIVHPFREDFALFRRAVNDLLIRYEITFEDLDEAQMIMNEVNGSSAEAISEPDYFGAYFKLIKLRLLYTTDYCKIKMSTLLSNFGYQRRSTPLVTRINRAMDKLGIIPQTRGYETCNIAEVKLDTMIMFRLATPDEEKFDDDVDSDEVTS